MHGLHTIAVCPVVLGISKEARSAKELRLAHPTVQKESIPGRLRTLRAVPFHRLLVREGVGNKQLSITL